MTADDPYDTEREVIAAIEEAQRRHALLPLLLALVLLIGLGAVDTFYSIQGARGQAAASRADVQRNALLTQQLTALTRKYAIDQQQSNDSAVAFRNDSRRLLLALCDQIEAISRQVHLSVPRCPRVPDPQPTAGPSPTPAQGR